MSEDLKTYSRDEVSKHNKSGDLWIIIHDKVYDVSNFNDHPGTDAVFFENAGKDATEGFEDQDHSVTAKKQMKDFLIGQLSDSDKTEPQQKANQEGLKQRQGKGEVRSYNFGLSFQ